MKKQVEVAVNRPTFNNEQFADSSKRTSFPLLMTIKMKIVQQNLTCHKQVLKCTRIYDLLSTRLQFRELLNHKIMARSC